MTSVSDTSTFSILVQSKSHKTTCTLPILSQNYIINMIYHKTIDLVTKLLQKLHVLYQFNHKTWHYNSNETQI